MENVKVSGVREGEEIFLSYIDDNDKTVSGYFILLKLSEALLQIKSNQNVIVIPITRMIKIKQRCNQ